MKGRGRHIATRAGRLIAGEARRDLAARHGRITREEAERQRAVAAREALEDLGPFYVKIGQILSTRPDVVPQTVISELEQLHDRVASQPFSVFEPVLAHGLGPDWRETFRDIDTGHPLGAASLAQTYRATLRTGQPAVVKVQRPGIRRIVAADMTLLRRLARLLARSSPRLNAMVDVEAVLSTIFDAMEPELDFRLEARNMQRARECAKPFEHLSVPAVITATEHVLIQTLAPGCSIRDATPESFSDAERTAISHELLAFMYRGFFTDRFFHADPHPGNIFVEPGQGATLIDWGMTGRLDRSLSSALLLLLFQMGQNNGAAVARTWTSLGHPTPWAQAAEFADDMAAFVPKVATASLDDLNFGVSLTAVLQYSTRRGIRVNPTIAILGKAFANIEGSIRCLCPETVITDILKEEIQEIIFHLARELLSEEQAACTVLELMNTAPAALQKTRDLLDSLANNDFTLRVTARKDPQAARTETAASRSRNRRRFLTAAAAYALWKLHHHKNPPNPFNNGPGG
ncbi:ABC1 kinase family protein [Streptomyces luteireticuli]|uniref:ABC1 kinase family protein n=1 Tax=Streptomyces luteireticuli TaxID=173858 RepID=UPI0035572155